MSVLKIIPNNDYHADRSHLSASTIKTILKNPYEYLNPVEKSNDSLLLGNVVHKLVLEPETFNEEFAVMPVCDRRTKAGKEIHANFIEESNGKECVTQEMYDQALEMSKAISEQKEIKELLLSNGLPERSIFSEIDGIKVKCRPDYYREDLGLIVDLKTTVDSSPDGFVRQVASYGYFIQAAFYLDVLKSVGLPANKFIFVAVSKTEPYMVGVYELTEQDIELGRDMYKKAFEIYRDIDSYKKPVYLSQEKEIVQTLVLPNYVYYKLGAM
ncbi:PD-(D/E)XK nuclease-like domain-containing protein [Sulfurovum sp. XTW-4]|uniref:PD-(D/E)XK nuclease-like domain-containing protein n=1 Tax=Sulfurovum xiamenensis TaxID=3019066 RepID=A0ABT7QUR9_9BACT|nr:PD-(D/E)XK nuclease-like domain-containing protein [Sulfurovum xiamenensis]MDM5264770.1 PD-(D/E)XK nuclease-like domain-containing protein [Sulfurovum xiamenensis]